MEAQLLFFFFICVVVTVVLVSMSWQTAHTFQKLGGHVRQKRDVYKDMVVNPRTKSEARAIHILKELTGQSFPTVNPAWLVWGGHTRELDGYCEAIKLALEFSGPLHTKWYPGMEPYQKYFSRIVTDVAKRKLCARHGVDLIVIDMSLPQIHWKDYMLSRLYDFGRVQQKPWKYIDAQIAKPFRNKHLEEEMGLRAEWKAVNKL
jgi:hypothetical protein